MQIPKLRAKSLQPQLLGVCGCIYLQAQFPPPAENCMPGSLWQAVKLQVDVVVWAKALQYTGLNQLLDKATPGQVLALVPDSGFFCQNNSDVACLQRRTAWFAQLTGIDGVGLLLLHWLPAPAEGSVYNATEAQTRSPPLPTQLDPRTATGSPNKTWTVAYSAVGPQSVLSLPGSSANTTLGGGSTATILRVVPTCGNGTLLIVERPLVPQDLPQATANGLPGLETYCWRNALSIVMQPWLGVDWISELWTEFSPSMLNLLLDPAYNITWFFPTNAALHSIVNEYGERV